MFEAEVLVRLMLTNWQHPYSNDVEFQNALLETTAEVLARSRVGEQLIEDLEPANMNFIAALWYAELCNVTESSEPDIELRKNWLDKLRRVLPSCFCNPDELF